MKSKCCNAEITIAGRKRDHSTNYYLCEKCKSACDVVEDKMTEEPKRLVAEEAIKLLESAHDGNTNSLELGETKILGLIALIESQAAEIAELRDKLTILEIAKPIHVDYMRQERDRAFQTIDELNAEVKELKEYKAMYEGLCK